MDNVIILINQPTDWNPYYHTHTVYCHSDYLLNNIPNSKNTIVINLSNDFSYNSEGYYCSLLAQTKSHRAFPSIETINTLHAGNYIHLDKKNQECCKNWLKQQTDNQDIYYINIYFGVCEEKGLINIARTIFNNYPAPLLRVGIWNKPNNQLASIEFISLDSLNDEQQTLFANSLDHFNSSIWRKQTIKSPQYSLAILVDPDEKLPPSNTKALKKLISIAKKMNIHAELITQYDQARLLEFDALFIRTTTSLNHYTYQFAQLAQQNNLVVIDDPTSIIKCTNKVYLKELFEHKNIPAPQSKLIFESHPCTYKEICEALHSPFIIKIPDGSFSIGMRKVNNEEEYHEALNLLHKHSSILLCQEYIYTDYDWRIGILNNEIIFACKYYMAKGHWQIYNHKQNGKSISGKFETISPHLIPISIQKVALKAAALIGNGLYGIDIKLIDNQPLIIEINDNPNIDHQIEDLISQDEIYYKILIHFNKEVKKKYYVW